MQWYGYFARSMDVICYKMSSQRGSQKLVDWCLSNWQPTFLTFTSFFDSMKWPYYQNNVKTR